MTTTTVSPIAAFAGGVVIGATATAVVIKYQKNIKATGAAVGRRAKSLFGKPVAAPVEAVAEAPVAAPVEAVAEAPVEAVAEAPVAAPVEAVAEAPVEAVAEAPVAAPVEAVAEAPVAAPVEAVAEAPVEAVAEAPVEAAPSITMENVEGVARLAELLSPSKTDPRSLVGQAIVQPGLEKPDIVILTEEVRAGLEESMKKPSFSTVPRHKHHHRRK
jgi:ribonuclease E